jgi:hypothetical protein
MRFVAFLDGKNLEKFNLTGLDLAEFSTLEVSVLLSCQA